MTRGLEPFFPAQVRKRDRTGCCCYHVASTPCFVSPHVRYTPTSCFVSPHVRYTPTSCFVSPHVRYTPTSCFVSPHARYTPTSCFVSPHARYTDTVLYGHTLGITDTLFRIATRLVHSRNTSSPRSNFLDPSARYARNTNTE